MSTSSWLRATTLFASLAAVDPALAQAAAAYPPPAAPPPAAYPPPAGYPSTAPPPKPPSRVQISAYTGWQMNGDISTYAGTLVIEDAMNYGAVLEFHPAPGTGVELLWIYNDTKAHFQSYDPFYPSTKDFSLQQHYFQIGGSKGFRRGKIEPFGGGTLGAALFIPGTIEKLNGNGTYAGSDTWTFAMTFGAGVKVFFSEKVALRLEGRMMLPMLFSGGTFYVGGGGSGMAVSAGIPSIQGGFTAGLTFAP